MRRIKLIVATVGGVFLRSDAQNPSGAPYYWNNLQESSGAFIAATTVLCECDYGPLVTGNQYIYGTDAFVTYSITEILEVD